MTNRGLRRFFTEETAQDLVEYAFLLGFVALGAYVGITSVGDALLSRFNAASTAVESGP